MSLHPVWLQDTSGGIGRGALGCDSDTRTEPDPGGRAHWIYHITLHKATIIPKIQTEGGCTCLNSENRI